MPASCCRCGSKGFIKRPKTNQVMCKDCFSWCFEEEIHWTIVTANLIEPGDRIAIGASGGKDSTVLAHVLKLLNERHNYGAELLLLSIDEGIAGYRDDSLETVKRNQSQYNLPLTILSYQVGFLMSNKFWIVHFEQDLFGWSMDAIVKKIGQKRNCTFCGIFRRQALDRGAVLLNATKICTGHNADDMAETVLMNVFRGDVGRLKRCTAIITDTEGVLPRFKPFKYAYEKEIVMYAHLHKLDYFSTECKYAPHAYRGFARTFIKDLERLRPRSIIDIINSGEQLAVRDDVKMPTRSLCTKCGSVSSQPVCQACTLLEGLNSGLPQLAVGKSRRPFIKSVDSNETKK
ncbi:Cytoplasmic tRNA 2-thiolation protein 1 [Fasciolopsis buskii]|uniref:Cytoplasmic tRNA 2-thiolation protein 1 n=1 Tax=Fasciolopsis buskii TaxID=27845 RepID=A0A8E0VK59_9TREM|nr:Cytoplasmic tRNA 2-thiolation protein 1 [Fasciolopsis buski]